MRKCTARGRWQSNQRHSKKQFDNSPPSSQSTERGARDGRAYKRDPLPVSIGDEHCAFRPVVIKALNDAGRDWRPVCEVSNMEPLCATVEADLAVVPLLASTVPSLLEILSFAAGLPPLPMFHINLHLPTMTASDVALELSRHIREQFAARYRRAA